MTEPRRKVLYIDDDEGLGALVRRNLGRRGYEVTLAANGEAGLALAREDAFDLIALDHFMPGQGGFETLVELRRLADPPPIVYVTGSDESRVAVSALKAGATDYVVKSVGEEFFDLAALFADEWDQVAFDPDGETYPLEHFEPMVREVFASPRYL